MLTRVVLKDFMSIAECDVRLGRLNFLVGPNGSGKSNFLRALSLISEALRTTLNGAVANGPIPFRMVPARSNPFSFTGRLEFTTATCRGSYEVTVANTGSAHFAVHAESCEVLGSDGIPHRFRVAGGVVVDSTVSHPPSPPVDRLYLVTASGYGQFRPAYEELSSIFVFRPDTRSIRSARPPTAAGGLGATGENIAVAWKHLDGSLKEELTGVLRHIMPALNRIDTVSSPGRLELVFSLQSEGGEILLPVENTSDGILRLLAVLVALQQETGSSPRASVIGIEEPEAGIYPAALSVLLDELRIASASSQIIATSHSPDLLDDKEVDVDSILAVSMEDGLTRIGPIDDIGRSILRDRLYTAGELLRMNQLRSMGSNLDVGRI